MAVEVFTTLTKQKMKQKIEDAKNALKQRLIVSKKNTFRIKFTLFNEIVFLSWSLFCICVSTFGQGVSHLVKGVSAVILNLQSNIIAMK